MELNLIIGNEYSKKEIEKIFKTGLGSQISGITPKAPGDVIKQPYVFLFSKHGSHYGDRIEGEIIYYVGHGPEDKDQEMKRGNRILAGTNEEDRIIFGFRREKRKEGWTYIGILRLLDVLEGKNELGYKIYEFKLKSTGIASPEDIKEALEDVEDITPSLTSEDETSIQNYKRKARKAAFSDDIKKLYSNQCAVCRIKRFNKKGNAEVEASHIYPKEKNGPDKVINGLSLCRLHHWAFDNGLLSISDDYNIIIANEIRNDENYEEIYKYEGHNILLPTENKYKPHRIYLKAHREMHGLN